MGVCTLLYYIWLGFFCYKEVCYDGLGCFDNKPPFHNANFEVPDSPDNLQVSFLLYTVNNINTYQTLTTDASQIQTTYYQGSRRTIFLTHGYQGGPEDSWILDSKNAILGKEDANVVVIGWENGANTQGNYFQAAANTRVVGALTANLMTSLFTSTGAKYEEMYIVGFSLGAHVAGYAGERVPNLGRITGLDPAYSAFSENEPAVRLDTTDATFVDIIHTDGKQLIGRCDHGRATEYFVESIDSACSFEAVPCESWTRFRDGQCSCETDCSRMGFTEKQAGVSGNYYLETNSQSPFCKI